MGVNIKVKGMHNDKGMRERPFYMDFFATFTVYGACSVNNAVKLQPYEYHYHQWSQPEPSRQTGT